MSSCHHRVMTKPLLAILLLGLVACDDLNYGLPTDYDPSPARVKQEIEIKGLTPTLSLFGNMISTVGIQIAKS